MMKRIEDRSKIKILRIYFYVDDRQNGRTIPAKKLHLIIIRVINFSLPSFLPPPNVITFIHFIPFQFHIVSH